MHPRNMPPHILIIVSSKASSTTATASRITYGRHAPVASGRVPHTHRHPHCTTHPYTTIASADISHTSMHPRNLRLILRKTLIVRRDMKTTTSRQESTAASPSPDPRIPKHQPDPWPPLPGRTSRKAAQPCGPSPASPQPTLKAGNICCAGRHSSRFLWHGSHTRHGSRHRHTVERSRQRRIPQTPPYTTWDKIGNRADIVHRKQRRPCTVGGRRQAGPTRGAQPSLGPGTSVAAETPAVYTGQKLN